MTNGENKDKNFSTKVEARDKIRLSNCFYREGEKEKANLEQIVLYIAEKYEFRVLKYSEDTPNPVRELIYFDNGVWNTDGETLVKKEVDSVFRRTGHGLPSTHFRNEVVESVKLHVETLRGTVHPDDFDRSDLIALENGVINPRTGEFRPATPDDLFFSKLPFPYDPEADCPNIKKFLAEVLHEDDIPVVLEVFAWLLRPKYNDKYIVFFYGQHDSGRSTLLRLMTKFIGPKNTTSILLHELTRNRFMKAKLFRKKANIAADIPNVNVAQAGLLKELSGNDQISAEFKGKDAFEFVNSAKLIFSANELPKLQGADVHLWERILVIETPNQFPKGDPKTDPEIDLKLHTKEELSGLFNLVLEAYRRFVSRKCFAPSKRSVELKTKWMYENNSVLGFVENCLELSPDSIEPKKALYRAYVDWCEDVELFPLSYPQFCREMKKIKGVTDYRPWEEEGERPRYFKGVQLLSSKKLARWL
ncbi:MAG: DNA primase family protein [Candidatus Freyarchaeota archaeon]